MEIISVVTLIVGIILSFSGAMMGMWASNQKSMMVRIIETAEDHARRIGQLEQASAVRAQESKMTLEKVSDIYAMLREHIDKSEGG